jgi:hypothetical protein
MYSSGGLVVWAAVTMTAAARKDQILNCIFCLEGRCIEKWQKLQKVVEVYICSRRIILAMTLSQRWNHRHVDCCSHRCLVVKWLILWIEWVYWLLLNSQRNRSRTLEVIHTLIPSINSFHLSKFIILVRQSQACNSGTGSSSRPRSWSPRSPPTR